MNRTKDDRNDKRLTTLMPLYCLLHFNIIAIIGGYKVRTNKQENNLSIIQRFINLSFPFRSCTNVAVMPNINETLPLQGTEVCQEFLQESFIFMSITEEDFYRHEY